MIEENKQLEILKKYINKPFEESKSQAGKWLKYKITNAEKGKVSISLQVLPEMRNPQDRLHGGVTALIFDEVLGLANYSFGNETFYTTSSLNVNYLYGADLNEIIIASAEVIKCGKKTAYIEGKIINEKNIEIARANTTLINTGTRIFDIDVEQ